MSKHFTKKMMKEAIVGSGGLMSAIAKKLNCHWNTAEKYVKKWGLEEDMQQEREKILDMAENKLFQNIQAGDNASIFFFLKTQGKERGYIERQDIVFNKSSVINVNHITDDDE